jgi:GT2 family glycosyltransferase
MIAALEQRSDAVAATCDKQSIDAPSGRARQVGRAWVSHGATRGMIEHGPAGISNSVFRAAAVRAAGGFDPALHTAEDLDLMLRVSLLGEWLYVPGALMVYRHRLAEARGEAPALAHWHADRRRTRAEVVERFLARGEIRGVVPERVRRRAVGRLWAKAGRQLRVAGHASEARQCFRRALRARPFDVRSLLGAWL